MNNDLLGLLAVIVACFIVIAICCVVAVGGAYCYFKNKQNDKEIEEEEARKDFEKARLKREIKEAVFQEITRYYGGFKYEKEKKTKSTKKNNN